MAKEPKTTTETGAVRIQMLVGMASMSNDRDQGSILTVGAAEAERLIEKGFAKRVGKATAPEAGGE